MKDWDLKSYIIQECVCFLSIYSPIMLCLFYALEDKCLKNIYVFVSHHISESCYNWNFVVVNMNTL